MQRVAALGVASLIRLFRSFHNRMVVKVSHLMNQAVSLWGCIGKQLGSIEASTTPNRRGQHHWEARFSQGNLSGAPRAVRRRASLRQRHQGSLPLIGTRIDAQLENHAER